MGSSIELELGVQDVFSAISQSANAAAIGVVVTIPGVEPAIAYVNQALAELTGYDNEEMLDSPWWRFVCPADRTRIREMHAARARGEAVPQSVETSLSHRDGTLIPVDVTTTQVKLSRGPADVSYVFDLRDRKMAEHELRSSEARFRQLVDAAPDGVLILRETRVLFLNPAAVAMFDLDPQGGARGFTLWDLLTPASVERVRQHTSQLQTGLTAARESVELSTKNQRTLELSSVMTDYDEQPAILAFARDVTERNAIQGRLVEADRLAAIGMLAAGVAHEINNPLAYVLLNLKYLQRELPKLATDPGRLTALQQHLADANQGAERVQAIVRDLRVYARTDQSKTTMVELESVVEAAIATTAHETEPRAQLIKNFQPVTPVRGDSQRLEQVFVNLLINAAQSIETAHVEGALKPRHKIEVAVGPGDPGMVRVSVTDTGTGVPADLQKRILEPFFTTKRPGQGTGLGLPICRKIVEGVGGRIGLESPVGDERAPGTRVWVELPEHDSETKQAAQAHHSSVPPVSEVEVRRRVLIIDDEKTVGQMLGKMLESQFQVTVCSSGEEALRLLQREAAFDAVLCDIVMPVMSGVDLYERLGEPHAALKERFIFMTGGALLPGIRDFLARVERPRIEKPFDLSELQRLIRECAN